MEAGLMVHDPALPFHKVWLKPDTSWDRYTKLYIAPVETGYLKEMIWWKEMEKSQKLQEEAAELAEYAREVFAEAFREDPAHRFQVVESPEENTLLLEVALVELIPSKIVLNTLGYAPFVGSASRLFKQMTSNKSSAAFEARLRDFETQETIALFADRETEKFSLVNFKDLSWWAHAQSILKEWAGQFVAFANRREGEKIPDSSTLRLTPW